MHLFGEAAAGGPLQRPSVPGARTYPNETVACDLLIFERRAPALPAGVGLVRGEPRRPRSWTTRATAALRPARMAG